MPEEKTKQDEREKELPDATIEKISGGWIYNGPWAEGCQFYPDDIYLQHSHESDPNTCPSFTKSIFIDKNQSVPKICDCCMAHMCELN